MLAVAQSQSELRVTLLVVEVEALRHAVRHLREPHALLREQLLPHGAIRPSAAHHTAVQRQRVRILARRVRRVQTEFRDVLVRGVLQIKEQLNVVARALHHHLVVVLSVENSLQIGHFRGLHVARHRCDELARRVVWRHAHRHPKIGLILHLRVVHLRRHHHHVRPLGELHA